MIELDTRFGRLVVLGRDPSRRRYVHVRCDCGTTKSVFDSSLTKGETQSCGCLQRELASERMRSQGFIHGLSRHPLYHIYAAMRQRCENKKETGYKNYGGRGIQCLFISGAEFVEWGLLNGWRPGLTIERKDNDGNYSKDNCRFATQKEQMRNMRRNRIVDINGERKTLVEWADILGVKYRTVGTRLHRGKSVEQALGLIPL